LDRLIAQPTNVLPTVATTSPIAVLPKQFHPVALVALSLRVVVVVIVVVVIVVVAVVAIVVVVVVAVVAAGTLRSTATRLVKKVNQGIA
jgi:hypothetical protein